MTSEAKKVFKILAKDYILEMAPKKIMTAIIVNAFFFGYFTTQFLYNSYLMITDNSTPWWQLFFVILYFVMMNFNIKQVGFNCDIYLLRQEIEYEKQNESTD